MADFTPFLPGDYDRPRFLFTNVASGYPPAVAWAGRQPRQVTRARRRSQRWGAWLRRRHFAVLAERRSERANALARLASGAERQGWFAEEERA